MKVSYNTKTKVARVYFYADDLKTAIPEAKPYSARRALKMFLRGWSTLSNCTGRMSKGKLRDSYA